MRQHLRVRTFSQECTGANNYSCAGGFVGDMENDTNSIVSGEFSEVDRGMCSWVMSIFTLKDDMILRKCGIDAIQYIRWE